MEKEEIKKKKKLKKKFKFIFFIIFLLFYSFYIGTSGLFIKEFKLDTKKIDPKMSGLKIIQFSDLHYKGSSDKKIQNIVKKINSLNPDIVIFTGDLINEKYKLTKEKQEFLIKALSKINSQLGNYYVTGEEDKEDAKLILDSSNFINLNDSEQLIYKESNTPILLIGKDKSKAYFENNKDISYFKMLALHNPNDFDDLKSYNFDVVLAGHTHNGQINIPKIKDLLIDSKYKNNYQLIKETKMYINPGIGNSKIKMRVFNHPTIYLYRLNKTSTNK